MLRSCESRSFEGPHGRFLRPAFSDIRGGMDQAPFDASTVVDAEELAEWLRLEAHEVRALALAGVLKRGARGMFPLVEAIRAYIAFEEAREASAGPPMARSA